MMDWKKLVGGLAPTLGAALGGPMVAAAVKVIADQVLGLDTESETDVASALAQGLSGEQIVALKQAEQTFIAQMREMDIDILKVNQATEAAYLADTKDARSAFAGKDYVFRLGVCILVTFGILMGAVLIGCFLMMTGELKIDPATAAICAGMIGTVVGYVAANAQQVVSYFFGSSKGSKDAGDQIGAALNSSIKAAGELR